jgi:hypothetical protein
LGAAVGQRAGSAPVAAARHNRLVSVKGLLEAYHRLAIPANLAIALVVALGRDDHAASDSHAYWVASTAADPYARPGLIGSGDAYLYSPPFAQVLAPLGHLPWHVFLVVWTLMLIAAIWALAGEWTPLVLFIPFVSGDLAYGNIHLFLALAIALSFRWPATLALVLLTKPTIGVCLLWFVFRGEWRRLGIALGTTAAIALASFAIAPGQWWSWLSVLKSNAWSTPAQLTVPVPVLPRLVVAAAVVAVAARRDWKWLVPVAAVLAVPVLYATGTALCLLLAVPMAAAGGRDRGWLEEGPRALLRLRLPERLRWRRTSAPVEPTGPASG